MYDLADVAESEPSILQKDKRQRLPRVPGDARHVLPSAHHGTQNVVGRLHDISDSYCLALSQELEVSCDGVVMEKR